LAPVAAALDEVVLTGYGNAQRKKNITASITSVAGKELGTNPLLPLTKCSQAK